MAVSPNITFGLPPLATPITVDGGSTQGIPYQSRPEKPLAAGVLHQAWQGWFNQLGALVKQLPSIADVAANMVPSGGGAAVTDWTPDAWKQFFYYQTDTGLLYVSMIVADTYEWVFVSGSMTVATLADLPAGLTPLDTGLIVYELEFLHAYQWTGSAWRFLPGDPGSGYIVATPSGPPNGGVWALCDGATVDVSVGDGTTSPTVLPNLMTSGEAGGPSLLGAGSPLGFNPATGAEWETGAKTEDEATHTHNVTATVEVQSGTGANPAATGPTSAGTAHSHDLTDANARLKKPSDSASATFGGGMPDRFYMEWYMRQ